MIIVKRGEPVKYALWEGTCLNCRSVMHATQSEIDIRDIYDPRGTAKCPVCKNSTVFHPITNNLVNRVGNIPG